MPLEVTQDDWTLIQGDDITRTYVIRDEAGDPLDLTDAELWCDFRDAPSPEGTLIFTPTLAVVEPATDGRVQVDITEAQTYLVTQTPIYSSIFVKQPEASRRRFVDSKVAVSFTSTGPS